MAGLNADIQRVRDIFGSQSDLRVPPYQRGFAWTTKQVKALVSDLFAAFDTNIPYFLGAFVLIQTRPRGQADVVDGQQRLSCLQMLISVLRDMARSSDEQAALQAMVANDGVLFGGSRNRWRFTMNHLDNKFFQEWVQTRGATLKLEELRRAKLLESQQKIVTALNLIRDEVSELSDTERTRFGVWLANDVSLVRVRVGDFNSGHRVYRAMNGRGLQLADHEILKSSLFELANFNDEQTIAHSLRWRQHSDLLGSEGFEQLLQSVRRLYDKSGRGDLIDGLIFSLRARNMPVSQFLSDVLPRYVDAWAAMMQGHYDRLDPGPEARRSIIFLRSVPHEVWRPPALKFLVEKAGDPEATARFFALLERLAFVLQYTVRERDYRPRRYRRVIDAIDDGTVFDPVTSPLNLELDERDRFIERLEGKFGPKHRRAIALRLNAVVEGGRPVDPDEDATLEHILPQSPLPGSKWLDLYTDEDEAKELTASIGNFTLLTNLQNQAADRLEFPDKKNVYFAPDAEPFALTRDLRDVETFGPDVLRARRDRLVQMLLKEWKLDEA